jgi:hypothetical protein
MAKKVLSAVLTMKDQNFSSGLKRASQGVKGFDKQMKYAGNQVKKFRDNTVSSFSKVAKGAAGLAAAYMGLSSLNNFKNEAVELAKAQIDAETKLAAVMKNTKGITDKHIQSVKAYASEVQNLGVIGDEVQLAGVQQLATFQLQGETLEKLMPGMADLIAQQKGLGATQEDAVTIGNMFGKVMNGQVGALSRAGINFTKAQEKVLKFGTESEKAATLAEVLKMNVGGVNKAMAKTDQGKIQQMQNAWGDYKEEIGKKILPLQAQFAGWFFKQIPKIQSFMLGAIDKGTSAFNKIKTVGVEGFKRIKGVIKENQPVIDYVKDSILLLGTAAIATKDWMVGAFQNIKDKINENRSTIDGVKGVLSDLGEKAQSLNGWLVSAFEGGNTAAKWLKDVGLPGLVDGIAGLVDIATGLYNYINDNWSAIEPIVYGIAGAILYYKGYMTAMTIATYAATTATTIWAGVTKGLTLAQGALNLVMSMSPLGWIAIAIGAVIAVGVALYKNWDTIKAKAEILWQATKIAFGIIKDSAMEKLQPVIDFFNNLKATWDRFKDSISSFKMPKIGLPKILGGNGLIQKPEGNFAVGSNRIPRDMIAQIHKDEMIVPASQSKKLRQSGITIDNIGNMVGGRSDNKPAPARVEHNIDSSSSTKSVTINVYPQGANAKQILDEFVPQLKLVLENM